TPRVTAGCHCSGCVHLTYLALSSTRRRQPRPTLFPYTTLFRSEHHLGRCSRRRGRVEHGVGLAFEQLDLGLAIRIARPRSSCSKDRKSTRLNSSHVKISYAVFCLKKKKKPGIKDVTNVNNGIGL